jgi:hypothetical protein
MSDRYINALIGSFNTFSTSMHSFSYFILFLPNFHYLLITFHSRKEGMRLKKKGIILFVTNKYLTDIIIRLRTIQLVHKKYLVEIIFYHTLFISGMNFKLYNNITKNEFNYFTLSM